MNRYLSIALAIGVVAGCAVHASDDDSGSGGESAIREMERRAVGPAVAYPADTISSDQEKLYATSKKARRELGWKTVAKALAPVKVAAAKDVDAGGASTIPLFRTWLGGDEIDRMFAKMYGDLGKERRQARDIPTKAEVDALYKWNETSLGPNSEAEYFDRLGKVQNQQGVDGLGGNARVAYSPSYVRRYFTDYPTMAKCAPVLDGLKLSTPPTSESNFTNCFSSEMPKDAAVVKMSWIRNDELRPDGIPVVDTSAATLAKRMAGTLDEGGWSKVSGLPTKTATPDEAYTVRLSEGEGFSLQGLHIMTKELRHWVWVTIWWSDSPDTDFGQDRPQEIKDLGGPWSHYKMLVVTDFEEQDPDPRGGFDGSLGDALAAVHGKATWASNGFIEKGAHNAQSNCMGCHQHAGDKKVLDNVLIDSKTYPESGRLKVREAFPADYSWAFATPVSSDQKDRLLDVIVNRMKTYDAVEGTK